MGPVCAPGAVTVPCENSAWDFGAYALYLHHTGNTYAGLTTTGGTSLASVDRFNDFNFRWGWGFKIEGSYHFSTGNDVNVNWYHWEKSRDFNQDSFELGLGVDILPLPSLIDIEASIKPQWDAVNFEFGQRVNFGEHKVIRFHGGAQWARIQRRFNVDIADATILPVDFLFGVDSQERFNGFGPRVGLDMSYNFGNGFAIYADGAAALLVGRSRFDIGFVDTPLEGPITTVDISGRKDGVVPEVDARLGATYTYAMGNGDLTLDVAWMVTDYINAVQFIAPADDFSLQGLIFGAKWVGNVA